MSFTEFYVTKGSSASDVNGGGPSLGTNDGPVDTSGNCSSDVGGTTITDDDAGGWPNASIGDWVCFDTAGVKEFARITGISGNDLTVTPAVTGSLSGKTANVGGAWATIQHAADTITTSFVNAAGDPPRVNIKYNASVYTEAQIDFDTNAGTKALPLTFEGYETTAGDQSANRPHISETATTAAAINVTTTATYLRLVNLKVTNTTTGDNAIYHDGDYGEITLCETTAASHGIWVKSSGLLISRCNVYSCGGYGIFQQSNWLRVVQTRIDGNSSHGLYAASNVLSLDSCVFSNNGGDGLNGAISDAILATRCIFYSNTVDGFAYGDLAFLPVLVGCVFAENGGYGINAAAVSDIRMVNCAFYGNTTGARNNLVTAGIGTQDLGADPFANAAADDFNIDDATLQAETFDLLGT